MLSSSADSSPCRRGSGHSARLRLIVRGTRHAAGADQQSPNALFVLAVGAGVANADRKPVALFDGERNGPARQCDFNFVLNVFDRDSVAGGSLAVDVDLHIALAHDRRGDHVACSVDGLEHGFDLLAHAVDRIQIGTEYFHADIGAYAGRKHFDAVDDRLRENVAPAGNLQYAAHFIVDKIALRARLARPEEDVVFEWLFQLLAQFGKTAEQVALASKCSPSWALSCLRRESLRFLAPWQPSLASPSFSAP